MRRFFLTCCLLGLLCAPRPALAEGAIGFAAPYGAALEPLGAQMLAGARLAAEAAGVELLVADEDCSAEAGAAAAHAFVRARVSVAAGFLCSQALEAALPVLAPYRIPVVTPGVRAAGLTDRRERTGWLVFRPAPRDDAEGEAVSAILSRLWRNELFAIVDDGTIHGRDLAETLRLAMEQAGLRPVFVDTFRPQLDNQIGLLGRLRRAGATHVFVGGDREDIAVMARDAAGLDYDLTIAGGEALRAAPGEVALAADVLMIGLPEWADIADPQTLERLREAGVEPEGYVLPAHAAVEIAAQAAARGGRSVAQILSEDGFETALGTIRFDARGDLEENPYRLFRYDGSAFVPVE